MRIRWEAEELAIGPGRLALKRPLKLKQDFELST